MKLFTACCLFFLAGFSGQAQYYYKDLVITGQTAAQWKVFHTAKVKSVQLKSFDGNGDASEGFEGSQELTPDGAKITTHTRTNGTPDSWIFTSYSSGRLIKTVDTSDTYRSTTEYQYDPQGVLTVITNTSVETDNHTKDSEQHIWTYGTNGKPTAMTRIRNGNDTTQVSFVADEKGNIAEEKPRRNGTALPSVYYYYDDQGRLTDVVRYNTQAGRLLPDYIFEYEGSSDRLTSMIVVPKSSNEYLKWTYAYDEKGLKIKESCTNRQKELVGHIEYQYTFK